MPVTLIHSAELSDTQQRALVHTLGAELRPCDGHYRIEHPTEIPRLTLETLRTEHGLDINTLPADFDPAMVRLLITDMDSTLINIECVDEIADFAGLKPQVAAITEAAMRGELDFAASLRKRVALLEGLDVTVLERVDKERLRLNPGAETLVAGLKALNIKLALVSGGFTFFAERLQTRLELDYTFANVLAQANGKLLGRVEGHIVGAEAKAAFLQQLCEKLDIHPHQTIAMGDGANDLHMLGMAGLGVAYHAKPAVRAQTHVTLQHRGLDAVLDFLATLPTTSAKT